MLTMKTRSKLVDVFSEAGLTCNGIALLAANPGYARTIVGHIDLLASGNIEAMRLYDACHRDVVHGQFSPEDENALISALESAGLMEVGAKYITNNGHIIRLLVMDILAKVNEKEAEQTDGQAEQHSKDSGSNAGVAAAGELVEVGR
jgi:hypothetical protein